eukprot:g40983.t1
MAYFCSFVIKMVAAEYAASELLSPGLLLLLWTFWGELSHGSISKNSIAEKGSFIGAQAVEAAGECGMGPWRMAARRRLADGQARDPAIGCYTGRCNGERWHLRSGDFNVGWVWRWQQQSSSGRVMGC